MFNTWSKGDDVKGGGKSGRSEVGEAEKQKSRRAGNSNRT